MNLLDENIDAGQREILRARRVRVRQIGDDIGRKGMSDDDILSLLHELRRPTFFTRDLGFYERENLHAGYGIICLAIGKYEVATFVRRLLTYPLWQTQSYRVGKIAMLSHVGMRFLQVRGGEQAVKWDSSGR
jgi:hypothetical protein